MNAEIDTGDKPPSGLSRLEKFVVLTSAIPTTLILTTMMPVLQKMQEALATSPNDALLVRLALTIVGFAMLIGAPVSGWIIDKIGVRVLLIVSVAVWIGLDCVNFAIHDLHILIVTRFVEGFCSVAIIIVGAALLGEIKDDVARAHLVGIEIMLANISGLVTLLMAGAIGDIDWRYTYFLHLLYIPALVSAVLLPKRKLITRTATATIDGFWRHFPYGLAAVAFMAGLVLYAGSTYMPYRYRQIGVDKSTLVAVGLAAQTITSGLTAGLFGKMRERFSAEHAFIMFFAVAGIGAVLAATLSEYWLTTAALLVYGAGIGAMFPNVVALASAAAPAQRGRITGIVKGLGYGASFVGAVFLEPIMRFGGAGAVMFALGTISLTVAVALVIAGRGRKEIRGLRPHNS